MIRCYIEDAAVDGLADEIYEDLEPRMMEKVFEAAEIFAAEARSLLTRKGPPRPGDPPAHVTGELHDAITALPAEKRGRGIRSGAGVWADLTPKERHRIAKKAAALEYGGTDGKGRKHPPFPYMRPAEERSANRMEAKLDEV